MFSSNNFLLLKILDSEAHEANFVDPSMIEDRSAVYKRFRRSLSSVNFNLDEISDIGLDEGPSDKRAHAIKAVMKTEFTYLTRIKELLTDMFNLYQANYDKLGKRSIMYQIASLMDNFPTIYELHCGLHNKMKKQLKESFEIGDLLFQFLSQSLLLDVYRNYVENFSNSMEICRLIKERKFHNRHSELMSLEAIVMSPIQRFPQLSMAIGDIYKYTPDHHKDKVILHKALAISKSITSRLDLQRREFEYSNFAFMEASLLKLKFNFLSKLLLNNNSVFVISSDFHIPRRLIKIPYYLILCNKNVVLLPRDVPLNELTTQIAFCYSLDDISFKPNVISSFRDNSNNVVDLEEVKNLYNLTNGSFSNDIVISEYKQYLNDYQILMKINENLKHLTFEYKGIDMIKISRSLIKLEHQLKLKEMELNLQLGAILTMTIKTSNSLEDKKLFLFDSMRQSNEWKMMFNRTKLLSNPDMTMDWKYVSFSKKLPQIRSTELPWLFEPFVFKDNGIIEIPDEDIVAQSVVLVVGLKIYRCLWVCLTNGWVIILHFDYKRWIILESFRMEKSRSVRSICVTCSSNVNSPDHQYDTEIWMASGDTILIHSLLENQRSTPKYTLFLPSEVESMCNVDNHVIVAMRSKRVFVYSKCQAPFWLQESEFSFKGKIYSYGDKVMEIRYGHGLVYIVFVRKIIVCKKKDRYFSQIKVFESPSDITTVTITSDGLWISMRKPFQLLFYDKMLDNTLQAINLPSLFSQTHPVGAVTSTYITERYTWLGTENGIIMCISFIDSFYCTDDKIPIYFTTTSSVGPITQIIPFQNITGINVKCPPEDHTCENEVFNQRASHFRRSLSNPVLEERHHKYSYSCQNIHNLSKDCRDELDSSSNSSLQGAIENLKNTTPMLVLALGRGIAKYVDNADEAKCVATIEKVKDAILFTFLE